MAGAADVGRDCGHMPIKYVAALSRAPDTGAACHELSTLQASVGRSDDPAVTNAAVGILKRLVVKQTDTTDKWREIRRRVLEAIKSLRRNDLTRDFAGEQVDAWLAAKER